MNTVIDVDNLVVRYGRNTVLDGLSFRVKAGEVFGFLGPNGAGKTTAIKVLLGLVFPARGSVTIHGMAPGEKKVNARLGFLPEEAAYYRFLSPVEILSFYGEICRIPRGILKKRIDELLDHVGLGAVAGKPLGTFSKGMAQKLGLAQCLINDPDTLILDEPMSGLDPIARMELRGTLEGLKKRGKTIFFSSHELSEVELISDTVALIHEGRMVREGALQDVLGARGEKNLERFFLETIKGTK